ncbi:nuclear transport factor 2 family protein [Staphylococcus americanisciuri]|nr:nuclear transport factor 2 family protein [Staphylococcus americanisciuri]
MKKDKQVLKEIYDEFYRCMTQKDTKRLAQILSQDFYLVHMTGYTQVKHEWLTAIDNEQMRYYSAREEGLNISVDGQSATVDSRNLVDARIYGIRHTWSLRLELHLENRNEQWLIIDTIASTY